ncbi:tetratricopeptide repeat protein [uncultured Kordia sp.]|uniref:tetratricopeptide repeat protein n=1 Tax=uncultured Kordia sp. TaxID=507699 RepID=UPI00261D4562|nr:tetratricopeptide repeat protein [uncultured Kordia sp.]
MKYQLFFLCFLISIICFSQETNKELIQLEENLNNAATNTEKIQALLNLGEYELDHNFGKAEFILQEAFQLTQNDQNIAPKYTALVAVQLGVLHRRKGQHAIAIKQYLQALAYFEQVKDSANIADVYHNIGVLHKFQRDYKASFEYLEKAKKIHVKLSNTQGVANAMLMIGSNYKALKKSDSSKLFYTSAKKLYLAINDHKSIEKVNNYLASLYIKTGKDSLALHLNHENIARSKKNNEKLSLVTNYLSISNIYYKQKEYRIAGKYVDSAIRLSKKEGFRQKLASAYSKKSRLWYRLENYKSAYLSHRKYKKYADSLFNIENTKKLQELELQYQFEKERQEISQKTAAEATQKWLYFILFLLTLVSAILASILVRRNFKNRAKIANDKLVSEQAQKLALNEKVKVNEEETKRLIADNSMRLEFKQELLDQLKSETSNVKSLEEMKQTMNSLISKLQLQITTEKKFSSIQGKIEEVNKGFDKKLREHYPKLTKTDREICALMRLNLSIKEISTIRNSSIDAVKTARYRIRKKMNLIAGQELEYIIQSL